jgi:Spy/CpxP family protein refolding chaperone
VSSFAFGALGALAVVVTLAAVRRAFWRRRFRHGPRRGIRFLAARIGARPDQERVLAAEADALAAEVARVRGDLSSVRDELAALLSAPSLDAAAVVSAVDARIARLAALRDRAAEGVARVHAALDPAQRTAFAELVRAGGHRRRHAGC